MQALIRQSDRIVIATGFGLVANNSGMIVEEITDNTLSTINAALSRPNGGVSLSSDKTSINPLPPPPPPTPNAATADFISNYEPEIATIDSIINGWGSMLPSQRQDATLTIAGAIRKTMAAVKALV